MTWRSSSINWASRKKPSNTSSAIETCRRRSTQPRGIPRKLRIIRKVCRREVCGPDSAVWNVFGLALWFCARHGALPGKRRAYCDSRTLHDGIDEIRGQVFVGFVFAARPENPHGTDGRCLAQAKVQAQIILREVARAASDLADLNHPPTGTSNDRPRSDGCLVTLRTHKVKHHSMV